MPEENSRSDQELIEAMNRGDDSAFEVLYWRYRDWVVKLAHRYTGNADDALDVLQETFSYFLRKFPGFELTARLTTFFYPVVKHLALAQRRKRGRFAGDDEVIEHIPAEDAEPQPQIRSELGAAMTNLPAGQREVLLMRFVDGMSLEEISAALEIPLGTVKSRLHNSLETLRQDPRTQEYFGR